jgi:hypothetical protein
MASAQFDCGTGVACVRLQPPNLGGALLDRSTAPGISRAQTPRRPTLTRAIPRTSRIAIPVKIAATRSVSDTFPRGLGGTTVVLTDGNGIASFTDLSLNLSVGNWLLAFTDTSASYGAALSNSIVVTPGPITSIVAEGGADTLYFATTSDTLHPAAMVIDAVGNGIPGVTVTWTVVNNVGKLDSLTTTTDINGVASPGNWLLSVAGVSGPFEILATPNASNVENAPLPIFAVQIPQ